MFYIFVLNVLPCITVLYCIDVCLSYLNKDYLLYLLKKPGILVQNLPSDSRPEVRFRLFFRSKLSNWRFTA